MSKQIDLDFVQSLINHSTVQKRANSYLLHLPGELRNKIYDYALADRRSAHKSCHGTFAILTVDKKSCDIFVRGLAGAFSMCRWRELQ